MLRKDVRQNLWAVGLALLFPTLALFVSVFHVRLAGFSPASLAEGLILGNLFCVLPLIALLTGNTLMRAENWPLVWTFPVSRGGVFARKLAAGALLATASASLAVVAAVLFRVPLQGAWDFWLLYGLLLAGAFLVGVWLGLAAGPVPFGLALLAVAGATAFLAVRLSGLGTLVERSLRLLGPGTLLLLALSLVPCLLLATGLLFLRHRLYSPWPNALAAVGVLVAALFTSAAGTAGIASRAFRVAGLERFTPYVVRLAGPDRLLLLGGNRFFSPDGLFGDISLFPTLPATVLASPDGTTLQTLCADGANPSAWASSDGRYAAVWWGDPLNEGSTWIRIFDTSTGEETMRLPGDRFTQARWLPDRHTFLLLTAKSLAVVDADRRSVLAHPLPPVPESGFSAHLFLPAGPSGLLYVRLFGDDAWEAYTASAPGAAWAPALRAGERGRRAYVPEPWRAGGYLFAYRGPDDGAFLFRDAMVYPRVVEGRVLTVSLGQSERGWMLRYGSEWTPAVSTRAGLLVLGPGEAIASLWPWTGGGPVWERGLPFFPLDGFGSGNEVFVVGQTPAAAPGKGASAGKTVFARLALATGQVEVFGERPAANGYAQVMDVNGSRGIVKTGIEDGRIVYCLVDLATRRVERVLGGTARPR